MDPKLFFNFWKNKKHNFALTKSYIYVTVFPLLMDLLLFSRGRVFGIHSIQRAIHKTSSYAIFLLFFFYLAPNRILILSDFWYLSSTPFGSIHSTFQQDWFEKHVSNYEMVPQLVKRGYKYTAKYFLKGKRILVCCCSGAVPILVFV